VLKFLCNYAGDVATSMSEAGGASTAAASYDATNLIAGPRSTWYRTTATSGLSRIGYITPSIGFDFLVIARADKLLTLGTMALYGLVRSSGGVWTNAPAGAILNPVTSADLLGPVVDGSTHAQDFVYEFSSTQTAAGFGLELQSGGSEATMFSKLFFGASFDFGHNPSLDAGVSWEHVPYPNRFFVPHEGTLKYETERRFSLQWDFVSNAKIAAFEALPQILNWPLFLYDDAGDIWDWQLEHVIVEDYTVSVIGQDLNHITIVFRRLQHYP
jgi:hypothetical protein